MASSNRSRMFSPTKIKNYTLHEEIGKGAFDIVYRATQQKTATPCAVKKICLSKCSEEENKRCREEARLLRGLDHAHLVKYKDDFVDDKDSGRTYLYIVMENCEQGSLRMKIESMPNFFTQQMTIMIFTDTCSAIEYLHKYTPPIVHRDVKTSNILFDRYGIVKLADLGVARLLEWGDFSRTRNIGTPYYMSPEVVTHKPYDTKTDIWSLGLCLYEMAYGKRVFEDTNETTLPEAICSGKAETYKLPFDNDEMTKLYQDMVRLQPTDRPDIVRVTQRVSTIKRNVLDSSDSRRTRSTLQEGSRDDYGSSTEGSSESPLHTARGFDEPYVGLEAALRQMPLQDTRITLTGQENSARKKRQKQILSRSLPIKADGFQSSGYNSFCEEEIVNRRMTAITVEVELSDSQRGFLEEIEAPKARVLSFLRKHLNTDHREVFRKIKEEIYQTRKEKNSDKFLDKAKQIFEGYKLTEKFQEITPFLTTLWVYQSTLLNEPPILKWMTMLGK